MKISLVIPFHFSATWPAAHGREVLSRLNRCLESVVQQDRALLGRVIVVANPDPLHLSLVFEMVRERLGPLLQVTWTEKAGANLARRRGAEFGGNEFIYYLDSDCILPDSDHLRRLAAVASSNDRILILGGGYLCKPTATVVQKAYVWLQNQWVISGISSNYHNTHLLGGNLLVASSVLERVNWDPEIKFGGSEFDLVAKAEHNGVTCRWSPHVSVLHDPFGDLDELLRKAVMQGFGSARAQYRGLGSEKGGWSLAPPADVDPSFHHVIRAYAQAFDLGRRAFIQSPSTNLDSDLTEYLSNRAEGEGLSDAGIPAAQAGSDVPRRLMRFVNNRG